MEPHMTIAQTAKLLGKTHEEVKALIRDWALPVIKIGHTYIFDRDDVLEFQQIVLCFIEKIKVLD
jgi:excisionase family DNA binding protein